MTPCCLRLRSFRRRSSSPPSASPETSSVRGTRTRQPGQAARLAARLATGNQARSVLLRESGGLLAAARDRGDRPRRPRLVHHLAAARARACTPRAPPAARRCNARCSRDPFGRVSRTLCGPRCSTMWTRRPATTRNRRSSRPLPRDACRTAKVSHRTLSHSVLGSFFRQKRCHVVSHGSCETNGSASRKLRPEKLDVPECRRPCRSSCCGPRGG